MTNGAKIVVALTTGTGIVGGGVGLTYALKPETPTSVSIRKQIEDSGKNILINGNSKEAFWDIKLITYKNKFHTTLAFQTQDKATLKQWCEDTLKKDFKNENNQNYSAAKALCTVPTNSEKILSKNKTLAKGTDWDGKVTAYNRDAAGDNLISEIAKKYATKVNLEQWCQKVLDKELADTGNIYTAAEKWCTKEG